MSVLAHNNKIIIAPNGKGLTAPGLKYETGRVRKSAATFTINHGLGTDKLILLIWKERDAGENDITQTATVNESILGICTNISKIFNGVTVTGDSVKNITSYFLDGYTATASALTLRHTTSNGITWASNSVTISNGFGGYSFAYNTYFCYILIAVNAGSEDT